MAAATVEEIEVLLKADASQFKSQMEAAAASVGSSMNSISGSIVGLNSHLETLVKSNNSAGKSLKSIDSSAGSLVKTLNQVKIAAASAFVLHGISDFIKATVNTQIEFDRIHNTLMVVSGSTAKADEEFRFLMATSQKLGLNLLSTSKAYAQFSAAAVGTALTSQQVRNIFLGVVEASTAMHLSAQQTEGALVAMQQMMSMGTVHAQELRMQLGNALPGAIQITARALGIGTQAVMKMMQQGQLLAVDVLPRLGEELHKEFGQTALTALNQTNAAINRVHTAMQLLFIQIAQSGVIDTFREGLDGITTTLKDPKVVAGIVGITRALSNFMDLVLQHGPAVLGMLAAIFGASYGASAGGVIGGVLGTIIPGAGTAAGAAVGTGIGAVIGAATAGLGTYFATSMVAGQKADELTTKTAALNSELAALVARRDALRSSWDAVWNAPGSEAAAKVQDQTKALDKQIALVQGQLINLEELRRRIAQVPQQEGASNVSESGYTEIPLPPFVPGSPHGTLGKSIKGSSGKAPKAPSRSSMNRAALDSPAAKAAAEQDQAWQAATKSGAEYAKTLADIMNTMPQETSDTMELVNAQKVSTRERQIQEQVLYAEQRAREAGIPLTAEETAQLHEQAAAYIDVQNKLQQLQAQQESFRQALQNIAEGAVTNFTNSLFDMATGAKSVSASIRDMALSLAKAVAQMIIFQSIGAPIVSAVQGMDFGSGLGSAIASLFGFGSATNTASTPKISVTKRAAGGRYSPGMPMIVGEYRPELMIPDAPGRIEPHVPPTAYNSGGSGGGSVQVIQNFQSGVSKSDLAALLPSIEQRTRNGVFAAIQQGGYAAKVVGKQ